MTKGMKSSEFWMTLVGVALGVYLAKTGVELTVILGVLSPLAAYNVSRGLAKKE